MSDTVIAVGHDVIVCLMLSQHVSTESGFEEESLVALMTPFLPDRQMHVLLVDGHTALCLRTE